jgi:hypothetical protein
MDLSRLLGLLLFEHYRHGFQRRDCRLEIRCLAVNHVPPKIGVSAGKAGVGGDTVDGALPRSCQCRRSQHLEQPKLDGLFHPVCEPFIEPRGDDNGHRVTDHADGPVEDCERRHLHC